MPTATEFRRQGSTSRSCRCDANLSCAGAMSLLAASGGAVCGCVASWFYAATYPKIPQLDVFLRRLQSARCLDCWRAALRARERYKKNVRVICTYLTPVAGNFFAAAALSKTAGAPATSIDQPRTAPLALLSAPCLYLRARRLPLRHACHATIVSSGQRVNIISWHPTRREPLLSQPQ